MRLQPLAFSVLASGLLAILAGQQSLPSKGEANSLLLAAIESQNLRSAGKTPFHLLARVHYDFAGKTSEGVYELLWAAPDRFRENFQLDTIAEIDVALGDTIHIFRNTPTLTPQFLHVHNFMLNPLAGFLGGRSSARRIYSDVCAGAACTCFAVSENPEDKACFDPTTKQEISLSIRSKTPSEPFDLEEYDFVSLGTRRYPCKLVRRKAGEHIEAKIEKLVNAEAFDADVFVPPPNSEARDWCVDPSFKKGYEFSAPPFPKTNPPRVFFPFYLLTGYDGHIEKFISLNPSAPPVDGSIAKWIHDAKFPIRVCGSKSIKSEQIIFMNEW
jgi:hypothetical protein